MMGPGMMGRDSPMGPGGMMGMMGGCPMIGTDGQASTFIDGRIAFLKAELAITDAQKSVWDAYADATKRKRLEALYRPAGASHAGKRAILVIRFVGTSTASE